MERKNVIEQEKLLLRVDTNIRQQNLEIKAFKVKQLNVYEELKEMEKIT